MATNPCQHSTTDRSWSHGQVARCVDCGAVNDPLLGQGWENPEERLAECAERGQTEAAEQYRTYIRLAREQGIPAKPRPVETASYPPGGRSA